MRVLSGLIFLPILFFSLLAMAGEGEEDRDWILITKSINVIDMETGLPQGIVPFQDVRLRIVEDGGWGHIVQLQQNGEVLPGRYITSKQWLEKMLKAAADVPEEGIPDWQGGCLALEKEELEAKDLFSLRVCFRSLQNIILGHAFTIDRASIFRALYRLRPEEQRFIALVFTVEAEVGGLVVEDYDPRQSPPHLQEMLAIMKVIENRMRNANRYAQGDPQAPYNELDIVLDNRQFSVYNADNPGWKKFLPSARMDLSNAIMAFIIYPWSKFEPLSKINRVYHYHANYLNPRVLWGNCHPSDLHKRHRVEISVDGKRLKGSGGIWGEDTAWGRKFIKSNPSFIRHIFYSAVDTCGKVESGVDTWRRDIDVRWRK